MQLLHLYTVIFLCIFDRESILGDKHCFYKRKEKECSQKQSPNSGQDTIWNTNNGDRILEQISRGELLATAQVRMQNIWLEWAPSVWNLKAGVETFQECSVSNCNIVQRSDEDDVLIDARLFTQSVTFLQLPYLESLNKTSTEIWIIHALESPTAPFTFHGLENIFNWTATYRSDSTLSVPYAKWVPHDKEGHISTPDINYAVNKTKLVAIFVSNCDTSNNRHEYVEELSKYIRVDIYGECGNLKCLKSENDKCFNVLKRDYKFYLAFENSNCRDYITEKFYVNALG